MRLKGLISLLVITGLIVASVLVPMQEVQANPGFPVVEAVNEGGEAVATTAHTVNLPAGIEAGDLLLVLFTSDGSNTITFPNEGVDWVQLFEVSNGAYVTTGAWYRIADGSEGATISVTTSVSKTTTHISYRISGYSGTPEVGTAAAGSSLYPNPPSLSPTWGADDTLWIVTEGNDSNNIATVYPDNYTDGITLVTACGTGSARRELNAVSEDPTTFTIQNADQWVANTIAIQPGAPPPVSPTVVTNDATSVEETTATLSGNVTSTGGANVTERGFEWDTDTGVPYSANWTEVGNWSGTGEFTHGVTGLTEGELYYYRAKAYNVNGWGYGSQETFLTKPDPPSSLGDTDRGNSWIFMEWALGSGADNTTVRYRTDAYPTDYNDGTLAYQGTGTSVNATGLNPGQIYYFAGWSWCTEGGLEQWSDTAGQDIAYTLPGDPANLDASNPSAYTIDLDWTKGTGGDKSMVRRKEGGFPTGPTDGVQAYFGTDNSTTDAGLNPETNYFYWVGAYDSDSGYYSVGSSTDNQTTTEGPAAPPLAPSELSLTDLGGITISANWTASDNASGYLLLVNREDYPSSANSSLFEVAYDGASTSDNLSGYALDVQGFFLASGLTMESGTLKIIQRQR